MISSNCLFPHRRSISIWLSANVLPSAALVAAVFAAAAGAAASEFQSDWPNTPDRVWIGPEYWANPMEDWRVADGRLECLTGGGNRNVHVLTRQLGKQDGAFAMSIRFGRLDKGKVAGSVGFRIGIRDEIDDYRARLFRGKGINAIVTTDGNLQVANARQAVDKLPETAELRLAAERIDGVYRLKLSVHDPQSGEELGAVEARKVKPDQLVGNIALVQNHTLGGKKGQGKARGARFWFRDWKISGSKVEAHDDQTFGPILWAMHTLSRGVLKMTAQMPPIGERDSQAVRLEIREGGGWKAVGEAKIHPRARTATFRVPNWQSHRDVSYRLVYSLIAKNGTRENRVWTGTVRKEPVDKPSIAIAGFTGNTDSGFPNRAIVRNVGIHNPDVLFFSGDQIYEGVGGYGILRTPVDRAVLNYLRKWYMFGWAFGDLMRDRPTISLPDDHDVYQGNIWGEGGIDCGGMKGHSKGGYAMHPDFVNAVHRTQTSHHPDLFDPTPIARAISVFHGDMLYGRISFAIIADRMFKSGPEDKVNTWKGRPDHVKDPKIDVKSLDKPNLKLLGNRQLKFLRHWAADWAGADMKIVLSQTIFCNVANYHGGNQMYLVADLDSNGWPQTGRNKALHEMRRGFALHYAGDQHLASIVHHGIDEYGDAGYSFCVPSIAAGYPRSWRADVEGRPVKNRRDPSLANTGDYLDGLGNRVSIHAVGNPARKNRPGRLNTLHDKASGYGIVRMNKKDRTITMECRRLLIDAANPKPGDQFPGWPQTIHMLENYGRKPVAELPTLKVSGMTDPVVQVIDQSEDEVVYTLRIQGDSFRPKVFREGKYTVKVGEPGTKRMRTISDVDSVPSGSKGLLEVKF